MRFVAFLSVLAIFAVPFSVLAEEKPAPAPKKAEININSAMPEELKADIAAYDKAATKFSPEQAARIKKIETEYTTTIEPDMEIFSKAHDMEGCRRANMMEPGIEPLFLKFRDHKNRQQDRMRAEFDMIVVTKVDFINPSYLKAHLIQQQSIQLQLGFQMMKLAFDQQKPEEDRQKCTELKAFLPDYAAKNKLI